jgi:hypothetical protein
MPTRHTLNLIIVIFLTTVLTCILSPQMPASAFSLDVHKAILYLALPQGNSNPTDVDQGAMADIVGSFWSGYGNLGSDLHQFDEFRHFDNASSPTDVCARASQAWSTFINRIDSGSQISYDPNFFYDRLLNATDARWAFGELTHALQDFYSHSNWIEISLWTGNSPSEAPLFPTCSPTALPPELQTGYFKLSLENGIKGCPKAGPPQPFKYCHKTLNKDEPNIGHGAEIAPGGMTYHQWAVQLAVDHTKHLYEMIRFIITGSVIPVTRDVSGACVARLLFQSSLSISCLDLSGNWTVTVPDPDTRNPGVGQVWSLMQQDPYTLVGTIYSSSCGTLPFFGTRGSLIAQFNGYVKSCPEPITGACPSQLDLPLLLSYTGSGTIVGEITNINAEEIQTECQQTKGHVDTFELRRSP